MDRVEPQAPIPGFQVLPAAIAWLVERRIARTLALPDGTNLLVDPPDRSSAEGRVVYREATVVNSADGTAWVFAVGEFQPIAPDRVAYQPPDREPPKPSELAVFRINALERAAGDYDLTRTVIYGLCDMRAPSRALFRARANGELIFAKAHPLGYLQPFFAIIHGDMQAQAAGYGGHDQYLYVHPAAAGTIADQLSAALQLERRPAPAPSPT